MNPDLVDASWMNTTLRENSEVERAIDKLNSSGLPKHPHAEKNWDYAAALSIIEHEASKGAKILDAGGMDYSPLVDALYLRGYRNLRVLNPSFDNDFERASIKYDVGDATDTDYEDETFDVITCLSVIEHGVNDKQFLEESYRILKEGGKLIISTDYWRYGIDTEGKRAYGTEVRVYDEDGIRELVETAENIGFQKTGEIDYEVDEKVVNWERMGLEFTFIVFCLSK